MHIILWYIKYKKDLAIFVEDRVWSLTDRIFAESIINSIMLAEI